MVDSTIKGLQFFLVVSLIVLYTFILTFINYPGSNTSWDTDSAGKKINTFDSGQVQVFVENYKNFMLHPILVVAAAILIVLTLFKFMKNKQHYKKQLIKSSIILILAILPS